MYDAKDSLHIYARATLDIYGIREDENGVGARFHLLLEVIIKFQLPSQLDTIPVPTIDQDQDSSKL